MSPQSVQHSRFRESNPIATLTIGLKITNFTAKRKYIHIRVQTKHHLRLPGKANEMCMPVKRYVSVRQMKINKQEKPGLLRGWGIT